MGNIQTQFSQIGQLTQQQVATTKPVRRLDPESEKALKDAKTTTRKLFATGAVGENAQKINSTVINVEKVTRLADGDVNAINIKAAIDLGEKVTRGQVQEVLGNVSAPLGAFVSYGLMSERIDNTIKDPNADNVKLLLKTGEGATRSFSALSKLVLENSGKVASFAGRYSDDLGRVLTKGMSSGTAGVVKTGLTGTQRALGHMGTALNVGVAGLDIYIAGKDIKNYWDDPTGKNLARMGLGLVAATGSILAASKIPGLSGKAAVVAALADVSKVGLDVNWTGVYKGTKENVVGYTQETVAAYKKEILVSRLPQLAHVPVTVTPASLTISQTLGSLNQNKGLAGLR